MTVNTRQPRSPESDSRQTRTQNNPLAWHVWGM